MEILNQPPIRSIHSKLIYFCYECSLVNSEDRLRTGHSPSLEKISKPPSKLVTSDSSGIKVCSYYNFYLLQVWFCFPCGQCLRWHYCQGLLERFTKNTPCMKLLQTRDLFYNEGGIICSPCRVIMRIRDN